MQYISHTPGNTAAQLQLATGTRPSPQPGELLIQVAYAGVNRPDVLQRAGAYPPPPHASPLLGLEVAGRVAALGAGVTGWQLGDRVMALTPGGGYAEFCTAPAGHALPVPAALSLREAACLPENVLTVWANVFDRCKLVAGEHFLVHGGSSGIGYTAIQLAKRAGATVHCTAGSAEKTAYCQRFGADFAYNYSQDDWAAAAFANTQKRGVDVILDMVGGDYIPANIRLLALEGRMAWIAFLKGGVVPELDCRPIMMKRLTLTGSTLRARPDQAKTALTQRVREQVLPGYADGSLKVDIFREFALADAGAAHALMETNQHLGKIVLAVNATL